LTSIPEAGRFLANNPPPKEELRTIGTVHVHFIILLNGPGP
jgi:hypothetical protein